MCFKIYLEICFSALKQGKHFMDLNCPNPSPPDCGAQGLANGNAMIITQKTLELGKLAMKC